MSNIGKIKRIIKVVPTPEQQPKPAAIPEPPPAEEEPIPAPSIFYPKPAQIPQQPEQGVEIWRRA